MLLSKFQSKNIAEIRNEEDCNTNQMGLIAIIVSIISTTIDLSNHSDLWEMRARKWHSLKQIMKEFKVEMLQDLVLPPEVARVVG